MTDEPQPINLTNRSGGADLNAQGDVNVGGDVVGRDKISNVTNVHVYTSSKEETQSTEKKFLIGEQLRIARENTGLIPTGFIELIDFHSEQQYRDMEANTVECPESVIDLIYEATGILPGWLKDPSKPIYEVELAIDWIRFPRETARRISQQSTGEIYVTIAASVPAKDRFLWRGKNLWAKWTDHYLHVGICVPISEYRYKLFDTNLLADFGNIPDGQRYARPFYSFLQELFDLFDVNCHGIILSDFKIDKELYGRRVYPRQVFSSRNVFWRINWVQRVLERRDDLNRSSVTKNCGRWIEDMQRIFLEFSKDAR
jgi:hypothetical protein